MLTILGSKHTPFCDGISRRSFLRIGSLGFGGMALPQLLHAELQGAREDREKSVVMIYLPGGPTQHETFDPKPNAVSEIRGSYRSISTAVPGMHFCELLPKLAKISNKLSIVRTLTGMENRHESFQCYTGRPGGRNGDNEPAGGWPSFGSFVSRVLGPGPNRMLPYVDAAPKMGYQPYNNTGRHDASGRNSWPGFTGRGHSPFAIEADVKKDLVLNGIDALRLENRRKLLSHIGRFRREQGIHDPYQEQALGLLSSSRLAEALDLELEDAKIRQRYGELQKTDSSFGGAPQDPQRFLMARRLVEAGVRCVTVAFGAWDWHANREGTIEYLSQRYLPVFDHALATFIEELDERGLLDKTSIVVWGEFGRTPRINPKGGRDHWPGTQSVLLAGGGFQGGRVVGRTDGVGGVPADRPVHVQEVFASLYQNLGIDVNTTKVSDLNGRPRYLVDDNRQPIHELR